MLLDPSCRGVIFDMDGVLLDTEPLYTIAYDRVMKPYGATLDRATKLEIMGRRAIHSAAHVIEKFNLPTTPEEFVEKRKPILAELFENSPPVPGAEEFVRALSARGLPLAVATSSTSTSFEIKTKTHEWFSLFNQVVCGDDPEIEHPKPAPDIFLLAAQRLGVPIKECVVFEDSPSGVRAGVASGAKTMALVREETDLSLFEGADRILGGFEEIEQPLLPVRAGDPATNK